MTSPQGSGGTPLGLGHGLNRPESRLSSVASAYYTDDCDGSFTDAGTITPGARDTETESQYFSDARSNLPNQSTASLAAAAPPSVRHFAQTPAQQQQQQQQQGPPYAHAVQAVPANATEEIINGPGPGAQTTLPANDQSDAPTPTPSTAPAPQATNTPRASIDDATRRAYEEDPIRDAEASGTGEKLGVAEGAAEIVNRQVAMEAPLKPVDGYATESGPTSSNRATVDDDAPRGQLVTEKPVPSPVSSTSSRDRRDDTIVDIEKRPSKKESSEKDSDTVEEGEKGKKKKGKKAKKEKPVAPEDNPDLAHFTPEQKRIILAQTEMGNEGRTVTYFDIFKYATKEELAINLIGLVAGAAAGVVQPLMTIVFGNLTTSFTGFANALALGQDPAPFRDSLFSQVNQSSLYLVYIGIGTFCTTYIQIFTWTWTGERITRRIREAYLRNVLRQNIGFFDKLGPGEVTTRISSDLNMIQSGISDKVPMAAQYLSQFVAGLTIAYVKNWRIALVLSVILPCIMIAGGVMGASESRFKTKMLAFVAEGGTLAEEVISSIRTSRAFGTEHKLVELYQIPNAKALHNGRRLAFWIAVGLTIMFFCIYSGYALAFWWSSILIVRGQAISGDVITVIFAVLIGSFSLTLLAPNIQVIAAAVGAANKVLHTIRRVPPIDSSSDLGAKPSIEGEIRLENVSLWYPSRPSVKVLDNYSVTFPKGQITALVGSSGSGKSSVISLIMRFYNVLDGKMYLDGKDLVDLNVRHLRANIGYVQQEPVLFATTIWENVAYGLVNTAFEGESEEVKRKMVKAACQLANADTFITNLPEGYDTSIGERGMLLSGGQKQRIAIARAVVSNPPILLLDEATSALDTTSEVLVQKALDQAATGRTTITIAHRLSTIKEAHKIVVMSAGKIVESGTHNDLLSNPDGAYAALVKAQTLKEQDEATEATEDRPKDVTDGSLERQEARETREAEKRGTLKRRGTGRSEASAVLEEQKQAREEEEKNRKEPGLVRLLYRLIASIWEVKLYYYLGTIASIVSGASYPVFAILLGGLTGVFGAITNEELRSGANRLGLYMFIVAIVSSFASFVQTYCFGYTSEYLAKSLRSRLFAATLRQDICFFDEDKNNTGNLTSAISEKPQKVNAACGTTLGVILQGIVTVVVGCIVALAYAWRIALVGIALIPLTLSAGIIQLKVVNQKDEKTRKAHSASSQMACEQAAAIRTVASLTREQGAWETYSESLDLPMRVNNRTAVYSNALFAFSQASLFFILSLLFWFGSRQLANGNVSSGDYFVALIATVFGATQAGGVFVFVPDVSSAKSAALAIVHLLDNEVEIDANSKEGKMMDGVQGELVFRNVHFRYPTRPGVRVLRGLDITVKPGQFVALVGPSGCGKSTIIQLAERFYDPLTGSIELDGQDLRSLNVKSMRENLALVSQEPTLYDGSVRFNITLGATHEVSEHDIIDACKSANIYDFVMTLPDGLDTLVGGKGSQLSGGQKQRVAIARALIRNPKVLLLDEATSALDSQSEKVVQAALDKAAKNRTTIAVAHRLSTIQGADVIYVLKDGRVAESGNHSELIRKKGIYFELVQQQALEKNA